MTAAAPGITRYSVETPCPICAGWDRMPRGSGQRCYGYVTASGKTALCTREEKAGGLAISGDTEAYAHPLHGECGCGAGKDGSADHSGHVKGQRRSTGHPGTVREHYAYRDERGEVLFEVLRWWPKDFTQRASDGKGGWKEGQGCMRGVRMVPWRLPELLADDKKLLLYCEGEKDANTGRDALFLPATTNAGGAGKLQDEVVRIIAERGRGVVIVAHNDFPDKFGKRAGMVGAEKTATKLHAAGVKVRILLLGDGSRDGYDLYDWVLDGGTREQLLEMIRQTPLWIPPDTPPAHELPVMVPDDGSGNGHAFGQNGFHLGPGGLPSFTDTRNAERLKERHGEHIRKDFTRGKKRTLQGWRTWAGIRWALDETEEMMLLAKDVVKHLPDEVNPDALHPETVKSLYRESLACESTGRLTSMISNAGSLLATTHEDWDANPWLLNCHNGTIELRSGELLAHDPLRYQSKLVPFDVDFEMATPVWDAFLERIFRRDQELISFVRRSIGLSLIGKVLEHILLVCYGTGANGKSTFLNVWLELLGDYSRAASMELMIEQKNPQHPTSIAELVGVRLVSVSEVQGQFSERIVKLLTGGDPRNARFLFEDAFTYTPSDTFWLATNHKPTITGNSEGIWRRIRLIPFEVQIPPAEQDRELPNALRAEYPGILAWAVRGCNEYLAVGLGRASAVDDATAVYRSEMDTLASFIADCCVVDPDAVVPAADLYKAFEKWQEEVGERSTSQRFFGLRLGERGFRKERIGRERHWHWMGIGLRGDRGDGPQTPPPPQQREFFDPYDLPDPPEPAEQPVENPDAIALNGGITENAEIKRTDGGINSVTTPARALTHIDSDTSTTRARVREGGEGSTPPRVPPISEPPVIPPLRANGANACNLPIRTYSDQATACPDCGRAMQHRLHVDHWDHDCPGCQLRFRS